MDSTTAQRLAMAWMRRKRWEHRALAAEVVGLLGQAMGGPSTGSGRGGKETKPARAPARKGVWVSGADMLSMMGLQL